MLIKPHIFRVRLFDRWWFGYAVAGRQPTLARSVRQLQEWFDPERPGWKGYPKLWCSQYWRYLETPQGQQLLVEMDHLNMGWSSQPGWFWAKRWGGGRVLARLSRVERGTKYAPSLVAGLDQIQPCPVSDSTWETRSTLQSSR